MDAPLAPHKTIKLTGLMSVIDEARAAKKALLFFDESKQLSVFFSYKATLFELNKEMLSLALGKKTQAEVDERFRKFLVNTMKSGDNLAIFVDASIPDFKAKFTDATCVPPFVFDMELMDKKENYKTVVRPDEDVDNFGNKNCYYKKDDWIISVVTVASLEEEGENAKKHLPLEHFMVVKVTN